MSFVSDLLAPAKPKALHPFVEQYFSSFGGGQALTGLHVSPDTALKVSAVWACVRVISDPLGWLPLIVYRRQADGGRQRATWHPIYELLHDQPNIWQTAMEFRKMLTVYALLRGDGLARILPGPRGAVDQLIPIHPDRLVSIEQMADYSLRYTVRKAGSATDTETLLGDEVFHLRFTSLDGVRGTSVIEYARETMGLGLATEQYAARFFNQNATPTGLLRHPGRVDRAGREKIKAEWEATFAGLDNAHRTAVVAEGIDYTPISLSNQDSQFLETREFGVEEVARWFGVPLHKIQHNSKTTSWGSGVEEMNQDFTSATLAPLATAWQQAISRDLILDTQNYYAEFMFDALSRGRLLDRYQAFHLALTDGWLSRNEVRQIENHNRADGLDDFLYAANMVVEGADPAPGQGGATPPPRDAGNGGQGGIASGLRPLAMTEMDRHYQALLAEAAGRVVRKEIAALTKAARRAGEDFEGFEREVREFYADHAQYVAQSLRMPLAVAEGYVVTQLAAALRFGVPALTLDEQATVALLCELAATETEMGGATPPLRGAGCTI